MNLFQRYKTIKNITYMKVLLILLLHCIVFKAFTQGDRCPCEVKMENEKKLSSFIGSEYIDKNQNNPLQYFSEWSKGEITFNNGDVVKDEYVLYNVLHDEVLWMREYDYKKIKVDRRFIKEFIVYPKNSDSARFVKVSYKNHHANNSDTFMKLLCDGNIRILKYIFATEASYTGEIYYKEVYFLNIGNEFNSFSLRPNSFFQLFGTDKKVVKQLFRTNRLSVKKESELIKGMQIYNESI